MSLFRRQRPVGSYVVVCVFVVVVAVHVPTLSSRPSHTCVPRSIQQEVVPHFHSFQTFVSLVLLFPTILRRIQEWIFSPHPDGLVRDLGTDLAATLTMDSGCAAVLHGKEYYQSV